MGIFRNHAEETSRLISLWSMQQMLPPKHQIGIKNHSVLNKELLVLIFLDHCSWSPPCSTSVLLILPASYLSEATYLKPLQPCQTALQCLSPPQYKEKAECDKQVEGHLGCLLEDVAQLDKTIRHVHWASQVLKFWSPGTTTCWHTKISRFHSPQVHSSKIDTGNSAHSGTWE